MTALQGLLASDVDAIVATDNHQATFWIFLGYGSLCHDTKHKKHLVLTAIAMNKLEVTPLLLSTLLA